VIISPKNEKTPAEAETGSRTIAETMESIDAKI
jgi:hypothetical protein